MRPCFQFLAAANKDEPTTLLIFDEIGFWGVQAKDFVSQLAGIKSSTLNVEINSPGGDVFAGLAIYNALKSSGKEIVTKVTGVAASAASVIFMAGDKRIAPKNTFVMVHNPWLFTVGNADELRDTAATLDKIGASLRGIYTAGTGLSDDEVSEMLSKDTWLTADEAQEKGFVTEVVEEVQANARFDMARADLPEHVKAVFAMASQSKEGQDSGQPAESVEPVEPGEPAAAAENVEPQNPLADQIAAYAKSNGCEVFAAEWGVKFDSLEAVKARVKEATEIKSLCAVANMSAKADEMIRAGRTVSEVRADLVKALAESDEQTHTDTSQKNGLKTGNSEKPQVSTKSLWASHNRKR